MIPTIDRRRLARILLALLAIPLVTRLAVYRSMPAHWGLFPPPRSPRVPGFAWGVFLPGVGLALVILAFYLRPRWFGFRRSPATPPPAAAPVGFPAWFWPGAIVGLLAWAISWGAVPATGWLAQYTFVPLWWGFICALDGLVYRRTGGASLLARRPAAMLAIALSSSVCWYCFEYLNYFILSNWYYPNDRIFTPTGYVVWFGLAYTTVLPSIFEVYTLLTTFPALRARHADGPRVPLTPGVLRGAQWFGAISLAALVVWPAPLFPLLWLSPLVLLSAGVMRSGGWTPFAPLARGDWSPLSLIALACVLDYGVGEMWNFYSTAANPNFWKYEVPYVDALHVFEMPLLGYFGYLPFGVLCWVWWSCHAHLLGGDPAIDVVREGAPTIAPHRP